MIRVLLWSSLCLKRIWWDLYFMSCNVFGTIWVHRRTWCVWTFWTARVNALKLFLIVPLTWWLMTLSQKRSTVLIDVPQGIVAIQYHSLCLATQVRSTAQFMILKTTSLPCIIICKCAVGCPQRLGRSLEFCAVLVYEVDPIWAAAGKSMYLSDMGCRICKKLQERSSFMWNLSHWIISPFICGIPFWVEGKCNWASNSFFVFLKFSQHFAYFSFKIYIYQ